jgi:archaellum component FlaC
MSDVVERYKEVNDQIDNISRAYENASKAADRLYGKARLNQMKEMNKILANEVDLLAKKRKEAEGHL